MGLNPRLAWSPLLLGGMLCGCSPSAMPAVGYDRADQAEPRVERGDLLVSGLSTPPGALRLPYVHYRQGNRSRPTVFFFGGGPGVSNLKHRPPKSWLQHFDVVLLEYRGVGRSSIVLDSPHFADALRKLDGGLSVRHAEPMLKGYRAAFADLRQQGVAFDEFSVRALADDVESLRTQLRLEQVYLVGHSFGTRVALDYQTRYRPHAAGAVLFAMNTPGGFAWEPEQTQSVWKRYRDALRAHDATRAQALDALLRSRGARARRYGPMQVNDAKALFSAFFLTFNGGSRNRVFDAMSAASSGRGWQWYLLSSSYNWLVRYGFNWADFFLKAYTADCDVTLPARLDQQGEHALFQSPSSVLFAGLPAYLEAGGRCHAPLQPDYRNTLAVIGEFDPSTPIERRPAGMPAERWKVVPGAGHGDVFYANPEATVVWLRRFLLSPSPMQTPSGAADMPGAHIP